MLLPWLGLSVLIVVCLVVDLRVAGRGAVPSLASATRWSIGWTALAFAFAVPLLVLGTSGQATEYLAGFVVEKSLSLDNLFVFAVLMGYFAVPPLAQRRVLVYGIAGALVLRAVFILVGAAALDAFHETIYVFGAFLVLTAVKLARSHGDDVDPETSLAMRAWRRVVPTSDAYDGDALTTHIDGRRVVTPLATTLFMIAAFDVLFAVDSVPAIFAISRDTYVVFAANAFSLLGMTSLYFLLTGLLSRFHYLSYGLAAVLAFVGVKMLLSEVWHPSSMLSLGIIVGLLVVAGAASRLFPPAHPSPDTE